MILSFQEFRIVLTRGWNDPEFMEEQNPNRAGSSTLSYLQMP
jgi:hypothetical protein